MASGDATAAVAIAVTGAATTVDQVQSLTANLVARFANTTTFEARKPNINENESCSFLRGDCLADGCATLWREARGRITMNRSVSRLLAPRSTDSGEAGIGAGANVLSHTATSYPHSPRPSRRRRRVRRWLVRAGAAFVAAILVLFVISALYVSSLPSVGDAESRVHHILAIHHGVYAAMPQPRKLSEAVVAVEDEHFYANFIINVLDGAGRAALATLQTTEDPGGSTIAQQLAKQLYGDGSGLGATLREIGLGVKLSLSYPKAEILNMYLNAVYYGHGYWGDGAAARGYFHTAPGGLDWAEAAMLAGLPQAPSAYDPLRHFALAKQRQRHVLDQLVVNHYLTRAQAQVAFRAHLPLRG